MLRRSYPGNSPRGTVSHRWMITISRYALPIQWRVNGRMYRIEEGLHLSHEPAFLKYKNYVIDNSRNRNRRRCRRLDSLPSWSRVLASSLLPKWRCLCIFRKYKGAKMNKIEVFLENERELQWIFICWNTETNIEVKENIARSLCWTFICVWYTLVCR